MWFKSLIYIIGSNLVQAAAIVSDSQISYLPFGCIEVGKKKYKVESRAPSPDKTDCRCVSNYLI